MLKIALGEIKGTDTGVCSRHRDQHIQSRPGVSRNSREEDLGARAGVGEQGRGEMPERVRPCWPGKGL